MAQLNFDATQVEPDAGFDTVPAGWYNVMMDQSDLKPTKDGAGSYLQARFNILDGQYKGRKLFSRLNIRNSNAQAQEIALRQLSAIGHAVGVLHIADSQQLHGIPLKIKVKLRPAEGQYDEQNEVISYKNINEVVDAPAAAPVAGAFGAPPVAPAGFGAPPAGFAQPALQAPSQPYAPPQQPAPAFAPQQAPQPAAQPWAAPATAQLPPQADPANPFAGQQPPAQPWGAQQPPAQPQFQAPQAQPAAPAADPAQQAAIAAAQSAPPPWANQG